MREKRKLKFSRGGLGLVRPVCLSPILQPLQRTRPKYTRPMDRVRFGRALGYGARHVARSLVQAAQAAGTPNPSSPAQATQEPPAPPRPPVAERVAQVRANAVHAKTHAGRLGKSLWSPLAHFSSVLWLQVTGCFFAVIAVFVGQDVWKQRGAVHAALRSHEALRFYLVAAICALFAYLAVSNFMRAARRERK